MNLKHTLLATAVALVAGGMALAPQAASAAGSVSNTGPDGTITFTGTVVAQTCTVDGSAANTLDSKSVTLPNVLTSQLASAGDKAGKQTFSISVAGCDAALSQVQAYWTGSSINTTTGNLDNATGTGNATNVQVQLLDENSGETTLDLSKAAGAQGGAPVALSNNGATLKYAAQYVATGSGTTAGGVNTSVDFTLIYQ